MTATPAEVHGLLIRLHGAGHPHGLSDSAAAGFARALEAGTPLLDAAQRAGLDPSLARMVSLSGAADPTSALAALLTASSESLAAAATLRAAGTYPLVLAFSVALTGLIVLGEAAPVLALLPLDGGRTSSAPIALAVATAVFLLVALSALVLGRVRVPGLGQGWDRLDGFVFLTSLSALHGAGAPLPAAIRAAGNTLSRSLCAEADTLAARLESGMAEFANPEFSHSGDGSLLAPLEMAQLVAAARAGLVPGALQALIGHRRLGLEREIPEAAMQVQLIALGLAGLALLGVGGSFFAAYYRGVVS